MPAYDLLFSETNIPAKTNLRLQRDALRYRWLRAQTRRRSWPQVVDGFVRLTGTDLDIAIDQAMHHDNSNVPAPEHKGSDNAPYLPIAD